MRTALAGNRGRVVVKNVPTRPSTIVLLLGVVAACFLLMLAPPYLASHVFAPADACDAGSLHGGVILATAFIAWAYFFWLILILIKADEKNGISPNAKELLHRLTTGGRGRISFIVLACCLAATTYGATGYYYASPDGLTTRSAWPAERVSYQWSDVTRRVVSCYRTKSTLNASLLLEMSDGHTVPLGGAQGSRFATHFQDLDYLTRHADNEVGDIRYCPCFFQGFVGRLVQVKKDFAGQRSSQPSVACSSS